MLLRLLAPLTGIYSSLCPSITLSAMMKLAERCTLFSGQMSFMITFMMGAGKSGDGRSRGCHPAEATERTTC